MELNKKIIELLNFIENLDYVDKEKIAYILEEIELLDESKKLEFLKYILSSSLLKLEILKNEEEKSDCQSRGHKFSEWEISILNKYGSDNDLVSYWKRTCTKCGLVDVSSVNPIEKENRTNKL